ncbi:hypothetical protein IL306_005844 [Fusarium sp. DS 682]|nr:hypothetical protein IL306_005844 [Fusarium sp. DS 682]
MEQQGQNEESIGRANLKAKGNTDILTHKDYTIGWICALPKELTAATAMLDRQHPPLSKPPNDNNAYTLGSIGDHNIVITCLPKGMIGNISAATVTSYMTTTFPSIKIGFMVGIGGGVPSNKVRLGDVVVSTPTSVFPGVVKWDLGKVHGEDMFERTGSLNNPPQSLLTALTLLETQHNLEGTKIPTYLEVLKQKWPKLASASLRNDSLKDVLFRAGYRHVEEPIAGAGENDGGMGAAVVCNSAGARKSRMGQEAIVRLLLEEGAEINYQSGLRNPRMSGRTAISVAAEEGHEAVVRYLLENGADPTMRGTADALYEGRTPLAYAAEKGHRAVFELLLNASQELRDSPDVDGETPISLAASMGHEDIVSLLLEQGVNPDSTPEPTSGRPNDEAGRTPLSYAAEYNRQSIVELLLAKGADPDSQTTDGRTPLWFAAEYACGVVRLLLEKGVRYDSEATSGLYQGMTPLSVAARSGQADIVEILLKRGANPNSETKQGDFYGITPLSFAVGSGNKEVVELLMRNGANLEPTAADLGKGVVPPFSYSARCRRYDIPLLLLEAGIVEIDVPDKLGRTPLSYVAELGHESIASLGSNSTVTWNALMEERHFHLLRSEGKRL